MSIQNKLDLAKRILGLGGEDKDITNIENISKVISTWDDKKSLIPDFKDLSKWIGQKNNKDKGIKGKDVGDLHIPNLDRNGDISSYLKKITEMVKGKDVSLDEELSQVISGIDGNQGNIPNKLKIVKEVFNKESIPVEEKTKLSNWILTLGGKGTDLSNIDRLHKIVSNIDGDGNSIADLSKLTDWISGLGGNVKMPFVGDLSNFIPSFDFNGNLESYLGKITDALKGLGGNGMDMSFVGDLTNLMKKVNGLGDKMPNKLNLLKQIFGKNKMSIQNKLDLAKRILGLGGEDKDISNIENISKVISTWDDNKNFIPDFKDLSKWIGRKNNKDKGIKGKGVGDLHIPNLDKNGDISSYLKKISEMVKGKDVSLDEELSQVISGIDGNQGNIPNKLKIVKEVFNKVSIPVEEKTKLSNWILTLGGKGTDLSNIDLLHKIVSNIDGDGNSNADFSKLTDWISGMGGNVEMPFVGELSNFLPRYDLNENLESYFRKITDSLKGLGGNNMNVALVRDFNNLITDLNENESKVPNKVAKLKDIFHKPSICMDKKTKLSKFLLELGGKDKDIADFSHVDDLVKGLQNIQNLFRKVMGDDEYFPACSDLCNTVNTLDSTHFTKSTVDILRNVNTPLDDKTKYYHSSNRLISDNLGSADMSLCSSVSGGRQLVSAHKDSQNDCKVRCVYQNEEEVLNSRNGWPCNMQMDSYNSGFCLNGRCVLEGVA